MWGTDHSLKPVRDKHSFSVAYSTRNVGDYDAYADDFCIEDIDDQVNIILMAKKGHGKTLGIRSLADRFVHLQDFKECIVNDTKGEMKYSKYPNEIFYKQLASQLPREIRSLTNVESLAADIEPREIPDLKVFSPEWRYLKGTIPFSLKFSSLSEPLAKLMLEVQSNAPNQRRVLNYMLKLMQQYKDAGEGTITKQFIKELKVAIPKYLAPRSMLTAERLARLDEVVHVFDKLMYCYEKQMLDGKYASDIQDLVLSEDKASVCNCVFDWSKIKWEEHHDIHSEYQVYLAAIIYGIASLKMDYETYNIKDDILVILDEMQPYLTNKSKSPVYRACKDLDTKGRQYGISSIKALQYSGKLDKIFLQNADYIFLGPIYDDKELTAYSRMLSYIFEEPKDLKLLQTLQPHEWLAVNTNYSEFGIVKFYPPLSKHITQFSDEV